MIDRSGTLFGIERRRLAIWGYALAAWIGAGLILATLQLLAPHDRTMLKQLGWVLLRTGAVALVVAWTLPFLKLIWDRSDEYMRAGGKFAWYWGGLLGLLASLPTYVFLLMGGLQWLWPDAYRWGLAPAHAFQIGYALPVALQFIGFLLALLWWRWSGAPRSAS